MDLHSFRAAYERTPTSRMEHDSDPARLVRLAKEAAELSSADPERDAIERYLAERARRGSYSAVEHLALFGVDGHLPLLWSLTQSSQMYVRIAAADVLCRAGHADRAWPILEALAGQALGRHPIVPGWRLLDAVLQRPLAQARDVLWTLTRVASGTVRNRALERAFAATLPEGAGPHPVHESMREWAEVPLDAIHRAVRHDLVSGDYSACWQMRSDDEERPSAVSALLAALRGPAPVPVDRLAILPLRHQNEVLMWAVRRMAYFFDPLDYWGGRWDSPWPVGGAAVVQAVGPAWGRPVLEQLLGCAQERGEGAVANEVRDVLGAM